ncbi:HD-GYP domain-containing protein [Thermobrachium celere]|uniref:HD-GYP domain-containing protein n=1 Tax=Thermobrachium celere TaxID=53422 RepID=UPI001945209F|nr:HD-GYP domain-containing protein [Thermobrachium celere]GFR36444.1 metal dependent phosphohydrolase [Thermobrachium celere]
MRLVSIESVKPGDEIGQSILGADGTILLREGVILTETYIKRLKSIGVEYLYIKDDNLDDIKAQDAEFLQLKSQAVRSVSTVFSKLQYNNVNEVRNTLDTILNIVEYLLENKDINSTYLLELKTFDNYTFIHSLNTCVLALFFGVNLNYTRNMLVDLGMGALLHDIGKTKIPSDILNKKGKLTPEEFEIMKKHTVYGYDIVKNINYLSERSRLVVLEHHERYDGSGYPMQLKGENISKFARIACISDVYDAIVSDRVYRKGFLANEAYEFILGGSGTFFDMELVKIFKDNFSIYPLGVCVKLSNGLEGFVVKHNKGLPDKPIVRIIYDERGNSIQPLEIDLAKQTNITIVNVIV